MRIFSSHNLFLYPLNNKIYFAGALYGGVFNSINVLIGYMFMYCSCLYNVTPTNYLFTGHMFSPELQFTCHYWCTLLQIWIFLSLLGVWTWWHCFNQVHKCFRPHFFYQNFVSLMFQLKFAKVWLLLIFTLILFIIILSIGKVKCNINYILVSFWDVWSWIYQTFIPRSFDCIAIYFNIAINML